jgi:phytoene dehydrogenase-like protein
LILLCLANFMIILDAQIVILALPSIEKHLGGAIYGFDQTLSGLKMFRGNDSVVPGLYLAGAWTGIGGFQSTLTAGADAADAALAGIGQSHLAAATAR